MAKFLILNEENIVKISSISAIAVSDNLCSFLIDGIWIDFNLIYEINLTKAYIILNEAINSEKEIISWNKLEEDYEKVINLNN